MNHGRLEEHSKEDRLSQRRKTPNNPKRNTESLEKFAELKCSTHLCIDSMLSYSDLQ